MANFIRKMAERDGLTDEDIAEILIAENVAVTERGPLEWGWVHGLANYLERKHPWLRDPVLERIVADVKAYTDRPDVSDAVHAIVRPEIGAGPSIVVSHSLGTVVAYWILAKILKKKTKVRLFVTAGSPLGLDSIKSKIVPPPRNFPDGVAKWVNFTDSAISSPSPRSSTDRPSWPRSKISLISITARIRIRSQDTSPICAWPDKSRSP